jgi:N-acetyl-1-D-myo-inositol-2-amino-2-deoxy-alpha-D-glucopyranoside deacetylase
VLQHEYDTLSAVQDQPFDVADVDELPFGVPDEEITTIIEAPGFGEQKAAALAAHRTQIAIDGPFFALSNMLGREVLAVEHFRLVRGTLGPDRDERGWETDLFSGIVS